MPLVAHATPLEAGLVLGIYLMGVLSGLLAAAIVRPRRQRRGDG